MSKGAMDLVAEAKRNVENLTPDQVAAELERGDAVLVDVREAEERAAAVIPGAISAPRGMLEFYADPSLPAYHKQELDPQRRVILHCASGGRSALGAATLKELGYTNVAHLDGGIKAWQEGGHPTEPGS